MLAGRAGAAVGLAGVAGRPGSDGSVLAERWRRAQHARLVADEVGDGARLADAAPLRIHDLDDVTGADQLRVIEHRRAAER